MRLVTYRSEGWQRIGAVSDTMVVDLSDVAPDMITLIEGGQELLDEAARLLASAEQRTALDAVELRAPIPRPRKNIICLGMNYAAHAIESARARGRREVLPEFPVFFTKSVTTVNHPGGMIPLNPAVTQELDWEVELAFVIGRQARSVAAANAMEYVFGYTILNDITARDLQNRHYQFFLGKSLDGSAPCGPWIVTADEIADPHNLGLRLRVNGQTMQDSNTSDLIFKIPQIIETLSQVMTLEPGDMIATGTPSGVAMGMPEPRWLQAGDLIEAEIDGIGVLRNTVVLVER